MISTGRDGFTGWIQVIRGHARQRQGSADSGRSHARWVNGSDRPKTAIPGRVRVNHAVLLGLAPTGSGIAPRCARLTRFWRHDPDFDGPQRAQIPRLRKICCNAELRQQAPVRNKFFEDARSKLVVKT